MPESQELTTVESSLPSLLSRLFRSKKLVVAGLATTISVSAKVFDIGTRVLDWAQRFEFVRAHDSWPVQAMLWLLTPTGQSSLVVLMVGVLILAIIWIVNAPPRHAPVAPVKAEPAAVTASVSPQLETPNKLTFEIDEDQSQVRVGNGPHEVRAIYADIKLRCFKASEHPMAIRSFHASLHKKWLLGDEAPVLPQEDGVWIWHFPSNQEIPAKDVWTVREPSTDYRFYHFILHITPQIQVSLSDDYVLRVTMEAVGQEPIQQTVYVHDWHVIEGGFSTISLKPPEELPLAATKEINRLKGQLRSYEKTNEELGQHLTQAEEGHKAEITGVNIELNRTKHDLEQTQEYLKEADKRATSAEAENLRLTSELELVKPSKRLREMEDKDAAAIQAAVVLSAIQFRNETAYGFRYVDFVFSIFNQSVYPISIDSLDPGNIVFNRDEFVKEKKLEDNAAQNVEPRRDGSFTIRQFLDLGDMSAINEATDDRVFRFENLTVNIKGGTGFEDVVKLSQLKIDCYSLSKQYPLWRNYNIGPFHSRFNGEITGRVREVYFQTNWLDSYEPGKDYSYDFDFLLHVFIVNHGTPKSIERFKFALKVNDELHEGERQSLAGFQVNRRDREPQTIKDIEDDNDENLFEKRGGWLRFRVRGIKRYEEDRPPLEIALDAIDSNLESNRLTPLAQSQWLGHAHFQESHVLGPGQWAEAEMKAHPEPQTIVSRNTNNA